MCADTSVEMVPSASRTRLYSSFRLKRNENERDVAALIDALGEHGLFVEPWLPKAGFDGRVFDLRVAVIAREARHVVMRTSLGPLTNLHLGNRRGDVEKMLEQVPARVRDAAWESCRRISKLFGRSLYFGVDLMFTPRFRRHAVL